MDFLVISLAALLALRLTLCSGSGLGAMPLRVVSFLQRKSAPVFSQNRLNILFGGEMAPVNSIASHSRWGRPGVDREDVNAVTVS